LVVASLPRITGLSQSDADASTVHSWSGLEALRAVNASTGLPFASIATAGVEFTSTGDWAHTVGDVSHPLTVEYRVAITRHCETLPLQDWYDVHATTMEPLSPMAATGLLGHPLLAPADPGDDHVCWAVQAPPAGRRIAVIPPPRQTRTTSPAAFTDSTRSRT
jgi:hypothetical protein